MLRKEFDIGMFQISRTDCLWITLWL